MRLVWTEPAQADLAEIADYIAADNPDRAISFINEIIELGEATADMPLAFALVPRLEAKGVRKRVHGRYLLLYQVKDRTVRILHVVHGARDYARYLFPEA